MGSHLWSEPTYLLFVAICIYGWRFPLCSYEQIPEHVYLLSYSHHLIGFLFFTDAVTPPASSPFLQFAHLILLCFTSHFASLHYSSLHSTAGGHRIWLRKGCRAPAQNWSTEYSSEGGAAHFAPGRFARQGVRMMAP